MSSLTWLRTSIQAGSYVTVSMYRSHEFHLFTKFSDVSFSSEWRRNENEDALYRVGKVTAVGLCVRYAWKVCIGEDL